MKYIIPFITCFLMLVACTKESDYSAPEGTIYTPRKNAFRATKISGTSTHWGNFTLYLEYDKEELNSIIRTNTQGDTVSGYGIVRGTGYITYSLHDYVPTVDKDSINRLDASLEARYGSGNYYLWDSIPKTTQSLLETTLYLYTDGRIKKQVVWNYSPNANQEATGEDFDYHYTLSTTTSSTYEYNTQSDVYINRIMYDVHDPIDKDLYVRSLYKTEALYEGNRIQSLIWFTVPSGENFTEYNRYNYTYNQNQISAIQGEGFSRKFTYSGNQVSMTTDGSGTVTYELDTHGNVVKMDDGKGNVYQIEYEPGHGNFSIFTSLTDRMTNPFFIK